MKKLFGLLSVVLVAVICFTQPVDAAKKEKKSEVCFLFHRRWNGNKSGERHRDVSG